jgi:hypothetical protein
VNPRRRSFRVPTPANLLAYSKFPQAGLRAIRDGFDLYLSQFHHVAWSIMQIIRIVFAILGECEPVFKCGRYSRKEV